MFKCYHQDIIWFLSMLSHFLQVLLEYNMKLVLERICDKGELITNITRSEMKKMLFLCLKNVHFSYNQDTYMQKDGVAVVSPLVSLPGRIFIVKSEKSLVNRLDIYLNF